MKVAWRFVCISIVLLLIFSFGTIAVLPARASVGGILNGGFESGDLNNWTIGGLGAHVEVLKSTNFEPNIPVPEGNSFVLLSTGPEIINSAQGPDLDGVYKDCDTSTLTQVFTLSEEEVPAILTFKWSFLTSEITADFGFWDDFFLVTLNEIDIIHGSVPGNTHSPFVDAPNMDGASYQVDSTGSTNGSIFDEGMCSFQTFYYQIDAPGDYSLEFVVADQADPDTDSGLLIDEVAIMAATEVVMSDGFEEDFPSDWYITYGGTEAYWGKDSSNSHGGSSSVFCAKSGSAGVDPPVITLII